MWQNTQEKPRSDYVSWLTCLEDSVWGRGEVYIIMAGGKQRGGVQEIQTPGALTDSLPPTRFPRPFSSSQCTIRVWFGQGSNLSPPQTFWICLFQLAQSQTHPGMCLPNSLAICPSNQVDSQNQPSHKHIQRPRWRRIRMSYRRTVEGTNNTEPRAETGNNQQMFAKL